MQGGRGLLQSKFAYSLFTNHEADFACSSNAAFKNRLASGVEGGACLRDGCHSSVLIRILSPAHQDTSEII